jgi:hypothetical protein
MHVDQSPKKRKEFAQKFPTPKAQTPELWNSKNKKQKTKNISTRRKKKQLSTGGTNQSHDPTQGVLNITHKKKINFI